MTRVEKVARAQALRAEGLSLSEVAERMGVPQSTATAYIADPDLSKLRARKRRYAKPCDWCGGATDGSRGYKHQVTVCSACRRWDDAAIVDSIQRWAEAHGGVPPSAGDWDTTDGSHPNHSTVSRRMGWNNALLRAGFGLKCDRRPETQEWIEAQLRAARPVREIADALGVSPAAIYERLRCRGLLVSDLWGDAA